MSDVVLRAPREDDWPAILKLAELSLAEFPAAPRQAEWMRNRKSFSPSDGVQQHFVATSEKRVVGYACIERRNQAADGWWRLFVVVEPSDRATFGTILLARLRECLISIGARHAWVMEFEADARFISFLEEKGFSKSKTLSVDGSAAVQLTLDAPFQSLATPT
jgi:N-acetylglutamate synthase-like GNAT family acetyltransferase